jgi:hypothetical protein
LSIPGDYTLIVTATVGTKTAKYEEIITIRKHPVIAWKQYPPTEIFYSVGSSANKEIVIDP